jgi:hypothetical protein
MTATPHLDKPTNAFGLKSRLGSRHAADQTLKRPMSEANTNV